MKNKFKFLLEKKYLYKFFKLLFSEIIIALFINTDFLQSADVYIAEKPIKNIYIFFVGFVVVYIFSVLFSYLKEESAKAKEQNERYDKVMEFLNNEDKLDETNKVFNMAIALDTFEPGRIKLLSDAAEIHHNLYAGVLVGNLYHSGLFNGEVEIVKKDFQKAYHFYKAVEDYDYVGVALWRLGWMFENDQIGSELSEDERRKKAFEYYKKARDKGYAKAYNSIGKFHRDGISVEKNPLKAIQYFREATERGDIYSILNEAYIHAEKEESFKLAIECYEKAIEQNTSLSYLKFGEFIEKNVEYFRKNKYKYDIMKAFDFYLTAIKLSNGPVAARAYYNIGCMLSSDTSLIISKSEEIQGLFGFAQRDIVKLAYKKSKSIFDNCIRRNIVLSDTDKEVYVKLINLI